MTGVAEGTLLLPDIRTFALEELAQAEALMESRNFFGKIVMLVP
jgi:NADPH:quinone reductase-like Zn-dependent oxidoreductase